MEGDGRGEGSDEKGRKYAKSGRTFLGVVSVDEATTRDASQLPILLSIQLSERKWTIAFVKGTLTTVMKWSRKEDEAEWQRKQSKVWCVGGE